VDQGEYRDLVIRQKVTEYAQHNRALVATLTYLDAAGSPLPQPTDGVIPAAAVSLRVTASSTFPSFIAQIVGRAGWTVSAQATARAISAAMPPDYRGLAPLTVPTDFYDACASRSARCDLWDSSYAREWGIPANEYKSLVDLSNGTAGGSISQNVSDWTRYGFNGRVESDAWLPTISGNHGNNVAQALRDRILADPKGIDPDGVVWGHIDIAIWDDFDTTTGRLHIAKFGRFKIRLTDVFGSKTYGHFIDFIVPGHDRGDDDGETGPSIIVLGE
jgi:hypothetical protein